MVIARFVQQYFYPIVQLWQYRFLYVIQHQLDCTFYIFSIFFMDLPQEPIFHYMLFVKRFTRKEYGLN